MIKMHKSIVAQTDGSFKTAELQGKSYIVIPVVAMIEGVRFGANTGGEGELGLASEFGKFPDGWNNRPVVLGHPRVNNEFVSAGNSPQVLEEHGFGFTLGTVLDDKKLKMEAWLDISLKDNASFKDIFERIDAGDAIEVSVGFFTEIESRPGQFKGQEYQGIWRNLVPDHLAFLEAGTIGACSIEDGCGAPRVNNLYLLQSEVQSDHQPKDKRKKKKLLEEDEEVDETMVQSMDHCTCDTPIAQSLGFKLNKKNQVVLSERNAQAIQHLVTQLVPDGILDTDVRNTLNAAIAQVYDFAFLIGFTNTVCVYDVFLSDQGTFITVQQSFTMDTDGNITFTSDPEEVRLLTRIVPIITSGNNLNINKEDSKMSKDQTPETQVPSEVPSEIEGAEAKVAEDTNVTADEGAEANITVEAVSAAKKIDPDPVPTVVQKAVTIQEYIAAAPSELKDALETMSSTHEARKQAVIQSIKDTGRCKFDDAYLNTQSLVTLEQLQTLADVPVYEGRAVPISKAQENDNGPVPAPLVFEDPKKKQAA